VGKALVFQYKRNQVDKNVSLRENTCLKGFRSSFVIPKWQIIGVKWVKRSDAPLDGGGVAAAAARRGNTAVIFASQARRDRPLVAP